jgi:hypothetical protein
VRVSFPGAVDRALAGRFGRRLGPLAPRLNAIFHASDDRSVSQRTAVIAFSVRTRLAVSCFVLFAFRPVDTAPEAG